MQAAATSVTTACCSPQNNCNHSGHLGLVKRFIDFFQKIFRTTRQTMLVVGLQRDGWIIIRAKRGSWQSR